MTEKFPEFSETPSFSRKIQVAINRIRNKEGFVQGKIENQEKEWEQELFNVGDAVYTDLQLRDLDKESLTSDSELWSEFKTLFEAELQKAGIKKGQNEENNRFLATWERMKSLASKLTQQNRE